MRIRITTAAVAAALAVSLVGCSSGSDNDADSKADAAKSSAPAAPSESSAPSSEPTAPDTEAGGDTTEADKVAPPAPTGDKRTAVIAAIRDVDPKLVQDEDKAIEKARYQCVNLDGGVPDTVNSARELFSYDGVTPTEDDARHINIGLRKTLCPEA